MNLVTNIDSAYTKLIDADLYEPEFVIEHLGSIKFIRSRR